MNLANLSSTDLRQIAKLLEQKEKFQAQIDQLNKKLSAYGSGSARGRKAGSGSGGTRRGQLKENVISTLKEAGKTGITVREIAEKLGTKPVNIHAWFHSTGKKVKGIQKVDGGKYRIS